MKPVLTVGLIGYQFMGRAHSNAFRQVPAFFDSPYQIRMKTLCGRTPEPLEKAREQLGWEMAETDWKKVVADPEIDLIDVVTPGDSHAEIALAALQAGKCVLVEKPLANNLAQAESLLEASRKHGALAGVMHNYRFLPAIQTAKAIIARGQLGTIRHFRARYLQDWIVDPEFPLVWRLQKEHAGSGTHGDLNSHIIDLAHFLLGPIQEVCGSHKTFIKNRPLVNDPTQSGPVTVDDATQFLATFENGALGNFEATRFATGRKNALEFEINGDEGSLRFGLERLNELELYLKSDGDLAGFRTIHCTENHHGSAGSFWPSGHSLGYEHSFVIALREFLKAKRYGTAFRPNFEDGYAVQKVLEAVEISAKDRKWITI